ncbi:unnamed protein product [Adineta steineri]|uniref:Wax synthase domain-containing protein n=1 Tax=Adineta steineri TaxID=433720 RepID=A0A815J8B2_9BILA|nr:unnamed protein product [Adineta steineri]CAF3676967.1 unnamed protein product [Adineta steineri]
MECLQYLIHCIHSNINDIKQIYLPTSIAVTALYLPIFLLSIFNQKITKLSKWILTIPIVIYLLFIPMYQPVRSIPLFNSCIAGIAIYYVQKVCEWLLIRRNEFHQWSFFDIQHELFYYRVYTQSVSIKKLDKKKKKEIFFTGPIQFNKHAQSLIDISCNIIKYYVLLDFVIYSLHEIFSTDFYENYYKKYLLVQIIVNQLGGCVVYLFLMFNYEIVRHTLCLLFNRPLELIPDLFNEPYRAISPVDFWSRWHQIFKNTWIELIFKPISTLICHHWPYLSKSISYGISSMCVFLVSGIMHEYTVYITLNKFSGDQIKFFLLQGFAVLIESAVKQQSPQFYIPKPIGFFLTFIFNGITAGYFIQPWIPFFYDKKILKYSFINFVIRNLFYKY